MNILWLTYYRLFPNTQNYTPAEELVKDREQERLSEERHMWELHCNQLHQEISNLATLCGNLQRDQEVLTSALNVQRVSPSPVMTAG